MIHKMLLSRWLIFLLWTLHVQSHAGLTKDGFTGASSKGSIILTMLQYQDDSIGVEGPHSLLPGYQHAAPLDRSDLVCPIPWQHAGSPSAPAGLALSLLVLSRSWVDLSWGLKRRACLLLQVQLRYLEVSMQ